MTIHQDIANIANKIQEKPSIMRGQEFFDSRLYIRQALQNSIRDKIIVKSGAHYIAQEDAPISKKTASSWIKPLYTSFTNPQEISKDLDGLENTLKDAEIIYPKGLKFYAGIGSRQTPESTIQKMMEVGAGLQKDFVLRSGGAEKADDAFERGIFGDNGKIDHRAELFLGWNNIEIRRDNEPSRIKSTSDGYRSTPIAQDLTSLFSQGHQTEHWDRVLKTVDAKNAKNFYEAIKMAEKTPLIDKLIKSGELNPKTFGMLCMVEKYHARPGLLRRGGLGLMARNGQQMFGEDLNSKTDLIIAYTEGGTGKGGTGQAERVGQDIGTPIIDLGSPFYEKMSAKEIIDLAHNLDRVIENQKYCPLFQNKTNTKTKQTTEKNYQPKPESRFNAAEIF